MKIKNKLLCTILAAILLFTNSCGAKNNASYTSADSTETNATTSAYNPDTQVSTPALTSTAEQTSTSAQNSSAVETSTTVQNSSTVETSTTLQTSTSIETSPSVQSSTSAQTTVPKNTSTTTEQPAVPMTAEQRINSLNLPEQYKEELRVAHSIGFNMDKLNQQTITGEEMWDILDHFVGYAEPDKLNEWETMYLHQRNHKEPLTRFDAMAALYLVGQALGGDWAECKDSFWSVVEKLNFSWSDYYFTYELYKKIDAPIYNINGVGTQYLDGASYYYNLSRTSPFTLQHPFAYDEQANSIHEFVPPTYAECVIAVVRLLASEKPELFGETSNVVPCSCILTPELIKKANTLPLVTAEEHPVWTGFVLGWDQNVYFSATTDNIQYLKEWGFNSLRIMIDYRNLFDENDTSEGKINGLLTLDRLVAQAIESGIHLNICLCSLPGRISIVDPNTYTSTGEFDLFINSEQQARTDEIWAQLAERYKDIPSAALSFTPFWEALNYNLSTGLPHPSYTPKDVGKYLRRVIGVIREKDSDRLIIYEPTANNDVITSFEESAAVKSQVSDIENIMISFNYCENPFVYACMTATEGEHIDNNNHSIPIQDFPVTYYGVSDWIGGEDPLLIDGFLPKGTVIDIYLNESDNSLIYVDADGERIYSEQLNADKYDVGYTMSRFFNYAKSDKCISITLKKDTSLITIGTDNFFTWSGMDVYLPEEYAIDQWWFNTTYDVFIGAEEESGIVKKHTSRIIVSPVGGSKNNRITICEDVSYTTPEIWEQSTEETVAAWCDATDKFDGNCIVRIEAAEFSGCTWDSLKSYYKTVLSEFSKHGFSWWTNEFWLLTEEYPQINCMAECPAKSYGDFEHFIPELLELLQEYSEISQGD